MAFTADEKAIILQFLKDNSHMSSYEASDALFDLGIEISYGTVSKYRNANNIDFDGRISLAKKVKSDIDAGLVMTAEEIMRKYKCSRNHANKSIKEAKGIKPCRKKNKAVVAAESMVIEPLPVNSMALYVQQLTSNSRKAVMHG
jgi:hypothetical protein